MTLDSVIAIRSELRKRSLALREGIPPDMRDAYSQIICKKTIEHLDSISARFVHVYIGFRSEVLTGALIRDLQERQIKIAVPIVRGEAKKEQMLHSVFENPGRLRSGKFGIPEPEDVKEVSISDLDAVIIPIVAFDGFGMRLGYGKGYYDRFLSVLPAETTRIGLAFSIQEVDKIPIMSHDELINYVITEQSTFFFE